MKKKQNENYYKKLRYYRIKNGFSYQQIASLLNMSTSFYWQLENKKKKLSYENAIKISAIFSLKPDDIFYE